MQKLHFQKKKLTLAENWNELDGRQLVQLIDVLHHGRTRLQQQIEALRIISGKCKLLFYLLKPEEKDAFLPYTDWVFKDNTLTRQLLPMYDELHGPADELGNLKMKEFHFTEQHYKSYTEEKQEADLNSLVATLYRPLHKGDRIAFDVNQTPGIARRVAQWPLALRLAILHWYDGCRQQIVELYDKVFGAGTGDEVSDEKAAYGLYGLMMDLAGNKLGTVQEVEEMYVHPAMASLELLIIDAERLEAQLQKA